MQTMLARIVRSYATTPPKVPLALIAELRKKTQVPITKAREALSHSNGDLNGALEWLHTDLATSGLSKAAKVAFRETKEGVVGVSVLSPGRGLKTAVGVRAAMVELNCETDFVARNELFARLAMDIAHTAAFISEAQQGTDVSFIPLSLDELKDSPLLSHSNPGSSPIGTVSTAIRDTIVKVGENITLSRASAIVEESPSPNAATLRLGSYVHGSLHNLSCGPVASLVLLNTHSQHLIRPQQVHDDDLLKLERSLARQIVGFETFSIKPAPGNEIEEQALYRQPFITLPGELNGLPVEDALKKWSRIHGLATNNQEGVEVLKFLKWKTGESNAE
jgi:elongation factor Ts